MFIRSAIEVELPAVAALVNDAYRGEVAASGWTSEAALIRGDRTNLSQLRTTLAGPGQPRILIVREERGGVLLGCVLLERSDADTMALGMLSIAPAAQNKGLGRRLIGAAEVHARASGASRIRIAVIQLRTPLIAWYERHGFVRTGGTEPFPYADGRFGTPLRNDLHFVVLEKTLA